MKDIFNQNYNLLMDYANSSPFSELRRRLRQLRNDLSMPVLIAFRTTLYFTLTFGAGLGAFSFLVWIFFGFHSDAAFVQILLFSVQIIGFICVFFISPVFLLLLGVHNFFDPNFHINGVFNSDNLCTACLAAS